MKSKRVIVVVLSVIFVYFFVLRKFSWNCAQRIIKRPKEWSSKGFRNFEIQTTWDGISVCHEPIHITLGETSDSNKDLLIKVKAPFFDSPAKPDGPAGQPFPNLWDYEVVEAFFLNDDNRYLEVELGPHGQHLLLLLNDTRNMVKWKLPITYTASIQGKQWTGEAVIPRSYLPPAVTKFNAYAIHGEGSLRQYQALYPETNKAEGQQPDFHRLDLFKPLDMTAVLSNYDPSFVSSEWAPYVKS